MADHCVYDLKSGNEISLINRGWAIAHPRVLYNTCLGDDRPSYLVKYCGYDFLNADRIVIILSLLDSTII